MAKTAVVVGRMVARSADVGGEATEVPWEALMVVETLVALRVVVG